MMTVVCGGISRVMTKVYDMMEVGGGASRTMKACGAIANILIIVSVNFIISVVD